MGHIWKERGYTCQKGVTLEKRGLVTLGKKASVKVGKTVTLGKMGHTWGNGFHSEVGGHNWKNGSHLGEKETT